jgi:hypothetical protein
MSGTAKECASTAVYANTLLDELDAMDAMPTSSSCDGKDSPRWLTARGWCEALGMSTAAQRAIGAAPKQLA